MKNNYKDSIKLLSFGYIGITIIVIYLLILKYKIMWIILPFIVGIVAGMYISSQIERKLEYNIEYSNETHKAIGILQYLKDNHPRIYTKIQKELCLTEKKQ